MKRRLALLALAIAALMEAAAAAQIRPQLFGLVSSDPLFDDSALHEIRLTVNTTDWQTLKDHYLENTYYPADFTWRGQVLRNVGIRSRGSGTRSGTKPHLLVNFSRYVSGQTLLGLQNVVLRNNLQDASNMHERLSMQLFKRMGLPYNREAFTKLYVNGQYLGLYTIVEYIDQAYLRRNFADDTGYLFSYDYPVTAQPYRFEYRGSDPSLYVPTPFKPETHSSDPHAEVVSQFVSTINLTGDAAFRTAIADYVDLSQFVRHVALEQFIEDDDGILGNWGMNNLYMYRLANSNRFTFLPWDKSDAFLYGWSRSIWQNIRGVPESLQNRLMTRALSYPDLAALFLDTITQCVQMISQVDDPADPRGWLEREITRQYDQIHDAALADAVKPFTNEQFEAAIGDLHQFAQRRGGFVMGEVERARAAGAGRLAVTRWRDRSTTDR